MNDDSRPSREGMWIEQRVVMRLLGGWMVATRVMVGMTLCLTLCVPVEVVLAKLVGSNGRVVHPHLVRHTVAVDLHQVAVDVVLEHVVAEPPLHAGPEGMASRHVRQGGRDVVRLRIDPLRRCPPAVPHAERNEIFFARLREPFRRAAILLDARLIFAGEVLDVGGIPGLEQEPAAEGRGPLHLAVVIERLILIATPFDVMIVRSSSF